MTALFNRWIPSLTLAVWSAVLLGTFFTGRLGAFLHPSFRPGVVVAGFALAALSLFIASRDTPPECCADASCTHPLARSRTGRWMTFLILVLPVSVAAWLSPEQFSKQAFEQRGLVTDVSTLGERRSASQSSTTTATATAAPATDQTAPVPTPATPAHGAPEVAGNENLPDYLQKTTEGYVIVEVLDLLYAVQDSQLRKDFEGRTVQLIAQMMPFKGENSPPNRFKAVRMFMSCCAADARPVATMVDAQSQLELPEMTWVRIVGKATFPVENGKRTAVIQATSVQQTKPPEETMLF